MEGVADGVSRGESEGGRVGSAVGEGGEVEGCFVGDSRETDGMTVGDEKKGRIRRERTGNGGWCDDGTDEEGQLTQSSFVPVPL